MTTSLSDAKILGGVGSILVLLAAVPNVGWILGIAGLVMILLAIHSISKAVNNRKIYDNMLTAVIFGVGAVAVGAITVVGAISHVLSMGSFVGSRFVMASTIPLGSWFGLALGVLGGLVAVWAILVVSAIFLRKSYDSIATSSNVKLFRTAGLLYLIGAATAIIGVGFVLLLVANILLAISFFSLREGQVTPQSTEGIPAAI